MGQNLRPVDIKKAGPARFKAIVYDGSGLNGQSQLQMEEDFTRYYEYVAGPAVNYEVTGALARNLGEQALSTIAQTAETIT